MSNQAHGGNDLVPVLCRITQIIDETPDVKTFHVSTLDGEKPFTPMPGQLGMFSLLNVGEGMFSIASQGEKHLEISIKRCGMLTDALHEIRPGQTVGLRGPYGNGFPIDYCRGKDMLYIGGGIGLAPVGSLIRYSFEHRADFGKIDVIYGARSYDDLVYKNLLFEEWPKQPDTQIHVTIDGPDPRWQGNVGFVPTFLEQINPDPKGKIVVLCGPPIMIKFCLQSLMKMGYSPEQVITTLEMRMKCGIGKCGRCNIGSRFICLDGPVFTVAELNTMPNEF